MHLKRRKKQVRYIDIFGKYDILVLPIFFEKEKDYNRGGVLL